MLSGPSSARIFIATGATDLRKSYDGLAALVEGGFGHALQDGDLFVFINRRGTQIRILYWERDGYCIWMKRLEAGTFLRISDPHGELVHEIDRARLVTLLEGVDVQIMRRRKRYQCSKKGELLGSGPARIC